MIQSCGQPALETLNSKLDNLSQFLAYGAWAQFYLALVIFVILSLIIAVIFGIWIETTLEGAEPSFVLLTKESYKKRNETLEKNKRKWFWFITAVLTDIVVGVLSNVVFYWLFAH